MLKTQITELYSARLNVRATPPASLTGRQTVAEWAEADAKADAFESWAARQAFQTVSVVYESLSHETEFVATCSMRFTCDVRSTLAQFLERIESEAADRGLCIIEDAATRLPVPGIQQG
ncbi:TPA: hypothetical protein ACP7Q5_004990 [Escherichia coli]|jgi:hypothetical protein|nr:hypothetical protein [Enterococcus faecium]ELG7156342.1 hypothetical protein [Staphylococcus aureus]MDN3040546.1 hypothetical protein [Enterococcus faecium]HDW3906732.1 hypothetical protein [Escherichia coli]